MSGRRRRGGAGLGTRLFLVILLVIGAGAGTLLLVSLLVAPEVFRSHLEQAGVVLDPTITTHVEEGFATALVVAIVAGVVAAALVAGVVAMVIARRVTRAVTEASSTAALLADGDTSARVRPPAMGPELDELAAALNTLADRLETTEARRQQLLTDVAHELRTPLTALEATVEAMADGVLPADEVTLATLTAQTRRLSGLTHDLTALSRTDEHAFTVHRRELDLRPVLDGAVAAHRARFASARVRLTGPATVGGSCRVLADPDRVSEIIDQLLDNAVRHCAPDDEVHVVVLPRPADGEADVVVRDTGAGFAPEAAEAIFERFHRGTSSAAGSGVGLTIARGLARAQGGRLSASSEGPGRGATFTLALPLA